MDDHPMLLDHVDKLHTTEMGIGRIRRNLNVNVPDVVEYCKSKILEKNCISISRVRIGIAKSTTSG